MKVEQKRKERSKGGSEEGEGEERGKGEKRLNEGERDFWRTTEKGLSRNNDLKRHENRGVDILPWFLVEIQ